ncbi:MAG: gluconeogenesis factor YvcK family protein [Patescibacteria group bacterium]|jgi:uncharacterized cofD-like protein
MAKRIVTIGGGTGQYTLLSGLVNYPEVELTAICPVSDSGGNTGDCLQKNLQPLLDHSGALLPPGDIGKCLLALSPHPLQARLVHRISGVAGLENYNAINALLVVFWQFTGDFLKSIAAVSEILEIRGRVLPVSGERAQLVAELPSGEILQSEDEIYSAVNCHGGQCLAAPIRELRLVPPAIKALPEVVVALQNADLIVIGPGCMPSSLIPILLVPGVKEAIKASAAKKVYLANVMAHRGEQADFKLSSFVREMEKYLVGRFDAVLANAERPADEVLARYQEQDQAKLVEIDVPADWDGRQVVSAPLLLASNSSKFKEYARHDAGKLAAAVVKLI